MPHRSSSDRLFPYRRLSAFTRDFDKSSPVRIGTSGYGFPSWRGRVYPARLAERRMLDYYTWELGFDAVELNFSYYHMPSERALRSIAGRVPTGFRFSVKMNRRITHAPAANDWMPTRETEALLLQFDHALSPLFNSGQYACTLLQFPHAFRNTPHHRSFLAWCREQLPNHNIVIEFRHASWDSENVFRFLEDHNLGFCAVDAPRLPSLMPLRFRATTSTFYLRLHGRNRSWFRDPARRYDYSYSDDELQRFARWIGALPENCDRFVFFNNCHAGAALRNAQMLKNLLARPAVH